MNALHLAIALEASFQVAITTVPWLIPMTPTRSEHHAILCRIAVRHVEPLDHTLWVMGGAITLAPLAVAMVKEWAGIP